MVGMVVSALYNVVDAYFVSGLGVQALGAIAVVFPLGQVAVGIGLLFGTGAASYVSRLLGQGRRSEADRTASTASYGSLLVAVALAGVALVGLEPLLRVLGAGSSLMPDARSYAVLYIAALVLNAWNVAMNNVVSSEGAAATTMGALLAGAILNVVLDPLCIYGLGMGMWGASLATLLSQGATSAVYLAYAKSGRSLFSFKVASYCWSGALLGEIFKIGVPAMLFQLLGALAIVLTNMAAQPYGDAAVAAMGVVVRIMALGSLPVFGFIKGLQPLAGFSYGARAYGRLRRAIRVSVLWSTGFCAAFGAVVAAAAPLIVGVFGENNALVATTAVSALRVSALGFVFFGIATVYSSVFLALGDARRGLLLGACRQGLCFVPVIAGLPLVWGLAGVVCAQPIADAATAIVAVAMARRLYQRLALEEQRGCSGRETLGEAACTR